MGTFVTANPHVVLPANRTDAPGFAPAGLTYEVDASHINDTQNAANDLYTHTNAWVNVLSYGADRTGVADSTASFTAAIAALFAWNVNSTTIGRTLYIPAGDYKISSTCSFKGSQGLTIKGEGRYATRVRWYGPASTGAGTQPIFRINSSQHVTIEDISFWGSTSTPPSECLFFDYTPIVYAGTAFSLSRILMGGDGTTGQFDYGIRWSGSYGNNSEVNYVGLTIEKFGQAAVSLEGSQQKNHRFYGCDFNGYWDGTTGHAGGQVGVDCTRGSGGQGGSFQWYGGNISSTSVAAFRTGPPNDPVVIDGCQCELVYRFLDTGTTAGNASTGLQSITVRSNRIDTIADHAADMIRVAGLGPFIIEGNQFSTTTGSAPYILISPGSASVSGRVRQNYFETVSSSGTLGVQFNSTPGFSCGIDVSGNVYVDASGNKKEQIECLNTNNEAPFTFPTGVTLMRGDFLGHVGKPCISVTWQAFTANATSQTVKVMDFPRGTKVRGMYAYLYNVFAGAPGVSAVAIRLGQSSGGNEYILDFDGFSAPQKFFGKATAELGTNLTTNYVQGGYVPDYFATTSLYVKLAATGGNVGNGTATNFTDGYFFIVLDVESLQRFVMGA